MKYVKCDLELMKQVFDESKKITRILYPVERVHDILTKTCPMQCTGICQVVEMKISVENV